MKQEQAEILAMNALAWLVGNDELLPVFLGSSGASTEDLTPRAAEPEFLVSVLEFLTMDDAWITAFCDAGGLAYDLPYQALQSLPGGARVHWT